MKRFLLVAASIAALLSTSIVSAEPAAAHPPSVSLRVATFNIQAGAGSDGVFDLDRTAEAIADLDADVVALQEVDVHWDPRSQWRDLAGELADRLHMWVYFGPIYRLEPAEPGQPHREYGNALLSRYPIRQAVNHEITRLSTQDPNPVPEPAPGFPEVVIKVRGVPVHLYSTHLDYRAEPEIRQTQVGETLDILRRDAGSPRILLGDFNAEPDAAELEPLWQVMTDAWSAAGDPDGGLTYPADDPVKRIDYIAVSRSVAVTSVDSPAWLVSDHRPVVAELTIRC